MIGMDNQALYTTQDLQTIRERANTIQGRIRERSSEIERVLAEERSVGDTPQRAPAAEVATADRVEEIRQSVTDQRLQERVVRISGTDRERAAAPQDEPGNAMVPQGREERQS